MPRVTETSVSFREDARPYEKVVEQFKTQGWVEQASAPEGVVLSHPGFPGEYRTVNP